MAAEQPSIFTRIIRGEIPCHRVYEDDAVLAFLDINPLAAGHTLVVPKRQVEYLHELTPDEGAAVGRALVMLAERVMRASGASGYNILQNNGRVAGQEVPHVHFHIIPRIESDGLGFRWRPKPADPDALAMLAAKLRDT
ncbi:MAG: HIT family protein [Planctomycetota bacterium]|nr:MAG: HIT family protein [Planctomycetota bacterium]